MKRHPLDLFSLLAGTVLTGIAIAALTTGLDHDLVTSDVFGPVVLIGLGVIALVATLTTDRGATPDDEGVDDAHSTVSGGSEPVES